MSRVFDRGAITAAWVGVGMAVTIGVSFLLVIPIEPLSWYLILPSGILIGYYANQRSNRRAGPWGRIIANAALAGLATGVTAAILLLGVKALFFNADVGYRDASQGGPLRVGLYEACSPGAGCVYQRYLADGRGPDLESVGVTDAASFSTFYWNQQFATAGMLVAFGGLGGLTGGALYGIFRPKADPAPRATPADRPA